MVLPARVLVLVRAPRALALLACLALSACTPSAFTPALPPTVIPSATALPSIAAVVVRPSAAASTTAAPVSAAPSTTALPSTGLPPSSTVPVPTQTAVALAATGVFASSSPTMPAGAPQVRAFSATLAAQDGGEGVLLKWEAIGDRVTICPLIQTAEVSGACLSQLAAQGTHLLPPGEVLGNYTGFRAVAQNAQGVAVAETAVAVRCPGYDTWFIQAPPPMCPAAAPLASAAAAQRFEHGRMIWVEATDQFFVLLDGQPGQLILVKGPLRLKPGASPEDRVGETPPAGYFEPVSGFGLLWRDELESPLNLRAYLGWAVEAEYGFATRYQCEIRTGPAWSCFVEDPGRQVLNLYYYPLLGYLWAVH